MSTASTPPRFPENGIYDIVGKPSSSPFILFMNVTNTITHLVLGAVAVSAIMFANLMSVTTSLKQHIYLCVVGYVVLMSQAILSLNNHTSWSMTFKYQQRKTIHWVMQIAGSALAIAGTIIRIINVTTHFDTPHGILGIIAMMFTFLSLLGGVVNLCSMNLRLNPVCVKILHACFGSLAMVTAFLTLVFAFHKELYRSIEGDVNADLCIALTVIALVGTLASAFISVSRRIFGK